MFHGLDARQNGSNGSNINELGARKMVEKKAVEHKKPGRLTFRAVNAALAAAGAAEVLTKGDGYFYFMEGDAHCWPATMVYVTRLNDLTVEQWIGEWRSLRADWLSRKS
jgi:hypothetical protein